MMIKTALSMNYCPAWGPWEAIREIAQNFLDAADSGASAQLLEPGMNRGILSFRNTGSIPGRAFLLGESGKAGTDARGKYGEGLKLALLVLARKGVKVRMWTGGKRIEPVSYKAQGVDAFALKITSASEFDGITRIDIPMEQADWLKIRDRFVPFASFTTVYGTDCGSMILDPRAAGKIFVKGIFVCDMPGMRYGYDLKHCDLDRDRSVPRGWDVEYYTGKLLVFAYKSGLIKLEELVSIAQGTSPEGKCLDGYDSEFRARVLEDLARSDADAFAVTDEDAETAEKAGLKAIRLPMPFFNAVADMRPAKVQERREREIGQIYDVASLVPSESAIVKLAEIMFDGPVSVADVKAPAHTRTEGDDSVLFLSRAALGTEEIFAALYRICGEKSIARIWNNRNKLSGVSVSFAAGSLDQIIDMA